MIYRMPVDGQSGLQPDFFRAFGYLGRVGDRRYETVVAGEADRPRTGLARVGKIGAVDFETGAACEIPGVPLEAVTDNLRCTGRSKDKKRKGRKESYSKQMVETYEMVDMEMRQEKPTDFHKTAGANCVEGAAVH